MVCRQANHDFPDLPYIAHSLLFYCDRLNTLYYYVIYYYVVYYYVKALENSDERFVVAGMFISYFWQQVDKPTHLSWPTTMHRV